MRALASSMRGRMSQFTADTLRRPAAARGRDPIVWLIVCGCVLVIAITLGTMMMVGEFRERAIANSERELQNAVLLLTRHFDQQFEDTEVIASDVMSQLKVSEIPSAEAFRARQSAVGMGARHDAHTFSLRAEGRVAQKTPDKLSSVAPWYVQPHEAIIGMQPITAKKVAI